MELPAGTVGERILENNKIAKVTHKDTPCVFEGFGEGLYYMTISNERMRRYFAYQNGLFTEPFGKAWFSDTFKLSYTSGQGITITQSGYPSIDVIICKIG